MHQFFTRTEYQQKEDGDQHCGNLGKHEDDNLTYLWDTFSYPSMTEKILYLNVLEAEFLLVCKVCGPGTEFHQHLGDLGLYG